MDLEVKRVPVLIVAGYAAAGKTHLVNRLLTSCSERKIHAAVICHRQAEEFGISPHVVASQLAVYSGAVYDFGSGCVCCSPRGELTRLLLALVAQREGDDNTSSSHQLDVLILRLGALASPLIFAKAVLADEVLRAHFDVASIVTVVNPTLAPRHLATDGPEWQARAQVACADLVLLNTGASQRPTEAGGEETINGSAACDAARALVMALNREASIECLEPPPRAKGCGPGTSAAAAKGVEAQVLGRRDCFSRERAVTLDPSFAEACAADASVMLLTLTAHDRRLSAGCAVEDGPLFEHKLRALCERLATSGGLLRVKGCVRLCAAAPAAEQGTREGAAASDGPWLCIDGVEETVRYSTSDTRPPVADGIVEDGSSTAPSESSSASKIFALGRGLAIGSLRRDFNRCRVPDGYAFAADTELHFAPRLTAASTATAGRAEPPCAVVGDLPGVIIVRVSASQASAQAAEFAAFRWPEALPPPPRLAANDSSPDEHHHPGSSDASIDEYVHVSQDSQHGAVVSLRASLRDREGAAVTHRFRLRDGVALPPVAVPVVSAAGAGDGPSSTTDMMGEKGVLRLLPTSVLDGAIYVEQGA